MSQIAKIPILKTIRHAPRATHYALRFTFYVLRPHILISLLLFLAGLYAYTFTLAPTVLEGDAALFEYTPYVLGVTYPTGYPLYILLGKLWLTLFPFGEIAWRMNLFSALCAAAALPLIYGAARRLFTPSALREGPGGGWGGVAATLIFATLPTFWRWSTEAKIYALNILLFSGVLYTLARALEKVGEQSPNPLPTGAEPSASQSLIQSKQLIKTGIPNYPPTSQSSRFSPVAHLRRLPLALPLLLLGLQISVHSTTVLLLPGLLLFVWLNLRRHYPFTKKFILHHSPFIILPGLLYFYIPLRAEWLIAQYGRFDAIGRGLLADFYRSGFQGFIRYFTAADFTGGVVTNWGLVPQQFLTVYIPLLIEDLTYFGAALGLIGGIGLALRQPRRFFPLFLIYAMPIPFVLTYGQGEQSAFLLPSFLIFSLFAGYTIQLVISNYQLTNNSLFKHYARKQSLPIGRTTPYILRFILYILLFLFLLLPQIQHNLTWLTRKWTRAIYEEWSDALNHPLEPGAGMLAHWGDLTSFWYMQHAEGFRPDLRGVYPPDEAAVITWFEQGNNNLYIAGPLQGWASGIQDRYQLIPWGRLVRIAPRQFDPRTLLPELTYSIEATFDTKLRLLAVDYPAQATGGAIYPVTLNWQALEELPPQTTLSLRLSQNGGIVAQLDERLRSGWFPSENLPAGQYVLSYALVPIPLGTLPGEYQLQLVAYTRASRPWTLPDGTIVLDLGSVDIVSPAAGYQPDLSQFELPVSHDYGSQIELLGYNYTVSRVGQGKGFGLELLWQAQTQPADNYTLVIEAVDAKGNILRRLERHPLNGRAPTGSWQNGQFIRDQIDLIVPASAPPGPEALRVRLSWRRPDGSSLTLHRWRLPAGPSLDLAWLEVTEKENRVFTPPDIQYPLDVNLNNKARLLGYNIPLPATPGQPGSFQLDRAACSQAETGSCQINVEFYWQGLAEMERPYQIFFHLVDTQDHIVVQQDAAPGRNAKEPTTGWLPGEIVAHPINLPLPPDLLPGLYTLRLGMYFPSDGTRLFILNEANQPVSDFIEVGTVEIEK